MPARPPAAPTPEPPPGQRAGARPRLTIGVLCAAVLAALLLPVTAAHAASRTVQGGRLDWGIKSSFQSYVTGPIAQGSFSLTGGAATVGSSQFRFPSAQGTYDGDTGAFAATFAGGVHFVGHRESNGTYQLDLTLSRPTVRISGSTGTLYLDITSKAKDTGRVTTSSQVPFASLALGGVNLKGGGTAVVLNNVPATLTAQGATSFAGYYTAGTVLDPVSLAADVKAVATHTATPAPAKSTPKSAAKKAKEKDTSGAIKDGAVDWGVRRTFREYVTGDIARGKWTLTAGAQDGGALFRFPKGEGTYKKGELTASFEGAVGFTGENGLDLTLSGVRVSVADGKGTLYADVSGGYSGKKVPLVTFTAKGFTAHDGLAKLTEAPAELTARGAKAFGGMYQAGTDMDPVSLAVALTDDATLPALPDLGSVADDTASPTPTPTATESAGSAVPVADSSDGGGAPVLAITIAAVCVLLAAAGVTIAVRRRHTNRPPAGAAPAAGAEATAGADAPGGSDTPAGAAVAGGSAPGDETTGAEGSAPAGGSAPGGGASATGGSAPTGGTVPAGGTTPVGGSVPGDETTGAEGSAPAGGSAPGGGATAAGGSAPTGGTSPAGGTTPAGEVAPAAGTAADVTGAAADATGAAAPGTPVPGSAGGDGT